MKKIAGLLAIAFLLASCSGKKEDMFEDTLQPSYRFVFKTVVIEGCEYFRYKAADGYLGLEHKGNCSNPIHIYSKPAAHDTAR